MDPIERWTCDQLLMKSPCFLRASFQNKTLPEMLAKIEQESNTKQICLKPPPSQQQTTNKPHKNTSNGFMNEVSRKSDTSRQSNHRSLCSVTPFETRKQHESSFSTYAEAVARTKPSSESYVVKEINLPKLNKHSNQTTSKKSKQAATNHKKNNNTQKQQKTNRSNNKQSVNQSC